MKTVRTFELYKQAYGIILDVYRAIDTFPKNEEYGLASQLKRAAVSIAANLAEGYRKTSSKEKLHFYNIALCSLEECMLYTALAHDLNYHDMKQIEENYDNLAARLFNYCKSIKANPLKG